MVEAPAATAALRVEELGLLPYEEALAIQRDRVERRIAGTIPDTLLFVEHPPVFTLGRNGRAENLLVPRAALGGLGIAYHASDRGGDITYHGPGQIVGYPIIDLRAHRQDLRWYVCSLERVLIETLERFGISGGRCDGERGVWIGDRKIAALGIHVSRWVTSHGFALNAVNDLTPFRYIVPCGIAGKGVTSMAELAGPVDIASVKAALLEGLARVFELAPENAA
ncbi:MAG: lipoyl(octanoyl) transferase LipB [Acidobacteriota bacterium]